MERISCKSLQRSRYISKTTGLTLRVYVHPGVCTPGRAGSKRGQCHTAAQRIWVAIFPTLERSLQHRVFRRHAALAVMRCQTWENRYYLK